jgi:hypothetical protein
MRKMNNAMKRESEERRERVFEHQSEFQMRNAARKPFGRFVEEEGL